MPTISERILLCGLLLLLVMFLVPKHYASAQYGCPPISGGYEPKVIARGENSGDVFVFWNYFYDCVQRVLFFKKSADNGNTFGNSIVIADSNTAGSAPAVSTSSDGNNLYVAWFKYTQPSPTLFFKKSTDNGATFGEAVKIDTNGTVQNGIFGVLASPANNNNIGIIWSGILANNGTDAVFLSKSLNGGESFSQPVLLGKGTAGYLTTPHMVQTGTQAYVLWSSAGDLGRADFVTKINMDKSDGGPFSVRPAVSLGNIGARAIAVSDDNVYVAGTTSSSADDSSEGIASGVSILLAKSNDGGLDFDKPAVLANYNSPDSNHVNSLTLDASENFVYLTWYNFHSPQIGAEIDARASADYGNTFGSIQKINSGTRVSEPIVTAASGDRFYVSWQDAGFRNNTSYQKLFFAPSSDGGNTFGKPVDLTGNAGISNPGQAMTADDDKNHVYIAWLDYAFKDGNHIMFTKNIDGGYNFGNATDLDEDSQTITEASSPSPEFGTPFALMAIMMAGAVGIILVATRTGWFGLKKS
jgi:hypothetical protein